MDTLLLPLSGIEGNRSLKHTFHSTILNIGMMAQPLRLTMTG